MIKCFSFCFRFLIFRQKIEVKKEMKLRLTNVLRANKRKFLNRRVDNFLHFGRDQVRSLVELNVPLDRDTFAMRVEPMESIEVLIEKKFHVQRFTRTKYYSMTDR